MINMAVRQSISSQMILYKTKRVKLLLKLNQEKKNVILTKFTNIKVSSETKYPQIRQNLYAGHHVLVKV